MDDFAVDMDNYWNYIGTPLFLIIMMFGIYVLFSLSSFQIVPYDSIRKAIADLPPTKIR
jgi:hypothetical protein